jgi:hypothetical protein
VAIVSESNAAAGPSPARSSHQGAATCSAGCRPASMVSSAARVGRCSALIRRLVRSARSDGQPTGAGRCADRSVGVIVDCLNHRRSRDRRFGAEEQLGIVSGACLVDGDLEKDGPNDRHGLRVLVGAVPPRFLGPSWRFEPAGAPTRVVIGTLAPFRGPAPAVVGAHGYPLLGHVHEAAVMALEGDRDGRGWSIAVLGNNEVSLAGARRFFLVCVFSM